MDVLYDGEKIVGRRRGAQPVPQRYLTVVVDHHSGRLVWAAPGRDRKTVKKFLDLLGTERCAKLELVSWPAGSPRRSPSAAPTRRSAWTPFTSSSWRPTRWMRSAARSENEARKDNNKQLANDLKGARFALWENAENLTGCQQLKARPDPEDQPAPTWILR